MSKEDRGEGVASWKPEEGGSAPYWKIQVTGHIKLGLKTSSGFVNITEDLLCILQLTQKDKSMHGSLIKVGPEVEMERPLTNRYGLVYNDFLKQK